MSTKLTIIIANFDTQLSTKLLVGATTGVLKASIDRDNVQLPSGSYCMVFDGGSGNEEHLVFTLDGVPASPTYNQISAIQHMTRQGAVSSGCTIDHRVGVSVRLTDFSNMLYLTNMLKGTTPLDGSAPLSYDVDPIIALTDAKMLSTVGYADTKASKAGSNAFFGVNTFAISPQIPAPTSSSDAVNLAYVLGLAFGGVVAQGFNKATITLDSQGRIKSVRDNEFGIPYLISYDSQDNPVKIYNGVNTWRFIYTGDNLSSITKV